MIVYSRVDKSRLTTTTPLCASSRSRFPPATFSLYSPFGLTPSGIAPVSPDTSPKSSGAHQLPAIALPAHAAEIRSIIAKDEPLTPGILYVGVAGLAGSVIARNREFFAPRVCSGSLPSRRYFLFPLHAVVFWSMRPLGNLARCGGGEASLIGARPFLSRAWLLPEQPS